jgi:hypothetical protein
MDLDFNSQITLIQNKLPELQNALLSVDFYYYPNVKNEELCITLIIHQQKSLPYKFYIYNDTRYNVSNPETPDDIISEVDKWLLTFDTVKNRQQKRNEIIKLELIAKVWHPKYFDKFKEDD